MTKQDFELIFRIVDRADQMEIGIGDRMTRVMDIENAHKQFGLRLEDFLNAEPFDFVHDFVGIQAHIDRRTGTVGDFFLPRFTGEVE